MSYISKLGRRMLSSLNVLQMISFIYYILLRTLLHLQNGRTLLEESQEYSSVGNDDHCKATFEEYMTRLKEVAKENERRRKEKRAKREKEREERGREKGKQRRQKEGGRQREREGQSRQRRPGRNRDQILKRQQKV